MVHSASVFEAANSVISCSQRKTRIRKHKCTRTQEVWEVRAAEPGAKLTTKYGEPTKLYGDVDSDKSTYHLDRAIAADFVELVLACARGYVDCIDINCDSAVLFREYILRTQLDDMHCLATALCREISHYLT